MSVKLFGRYLVFQMETLLLAVPIVMFFGLMIVYQIFAIDPYISVSVPFILSNNIIVLHLGFFIVPYIVHRFLRSKEQGEYTFKLLHVLLSVFLLFAIMFSYQVVRPTYPYQQVGVFTERENKFWMEATMATYIILGAQIVVQVIFLMYSLTVIFPPKQKDVVAELSL